MSVDCFIDTNVLLYAATGTDAERVKREKAQALIATANFGISTQVLQEFFVRQPDRLAVDPDIELKLAAGGQIDSIVCPGTIAVLRLVMLMARA